MLQRIITSIVGIGVLIPILLLSDTYVFPVAIAICTIIALYEMFGCLGCKNKYAITIPSYILGAVIPILGKVLGGVDKMYPLLCTIFVLITMYLFSLAVFAHKKYTVTDITSCYFNIVYIIAGFSSIVFLKLLYDNFYLLIFIGAWVTDIFAYFTGKFLGKHKLCETISPKKTIEGSIGGILFCALSFVIFGLIVARGEASKPSFYVVLAVMGIIISIVSQIGDLSMSLVKRQYGIKDFGKLFPGHGGILDRFDSIMPVAVVLLILVLVLNSFQIMPN